MSTLIQPRILKGFRDFLPQDEIFRADLIEKLTQTYRSYGFVPIDTPILEYTEILLRKSNGETEKQMFRFQDNGNRDVAMRFDLTVPFARFTAEHKEDLYFPFKRYHIAKVWRGEKPQAGRYREFVQCDFDTVGSDSANADFEILSLIKSSLSSIGVTNICIHINHRGIFNKFLDTISCRDKSEDILRSVDKIAKIGKEKVLDEILGITDSKENADKIMEYIEPQGDFLSTLEHIEFLAGGVCEESQRVRDIYAMLKASNIENFYILDPSITRGLDYYTGIVYETFLTDIPTIGSVCSGGRYDNLAGLYMKDKVPGVGASIGLDRLIAALQELGLQSNKGSYLDVEIYNEDSNLSIEYQKLSTQLRILGVATEVFPDCVKMAKQYAVTEKKNVPWGIFLGKNYTESRLFTLKNLKTREQFIDINIEKALKLIKNESNQ